MTDFSPDFSPNLSPESAPDLYNPIPPAPEGFRSGFISIVGRPNVGKSTLLNHLVGQKIAIVSPVAQTTRNRLQGILTRPDAQMILIDTPGIHKPHHQLGKVLVQNARIAIQAADVLLFVVDGSVPAGRGDAFVADLLDRAGVPVVLGVNKADLFAPGDEPATDELATENPADGLATDHPAANGLATENPAADGLAADAPSSPQPPAPAQPTADGLNHRGSDRRPSTHPSTHPSTDPLASYRDLVGDRPWPILQFSALTGTGTDALLSCLVDRLEPGPYYFPPDFVTDRPERFIMGELIREQILLHTREEVPHSVAVGIDRVDEDPDITRILATIHVERSSQKGILIGKRGAMLKTIGTAARQQIQKLIAGRVYLELFVRVQPKWRQSRDCLADFGYRVEET